MPTGCFGSTEGTIKVFIALEGYCYLYSTKMGNHGVLPRLNRVSQMNNLSHFAWAVLDQFRQQPSVWDGDLVSKTGRSELIANGLAKRDGKGMNSLTSDGRKLAVRLLAEGRRVYS